MFNNVKQTNSNWTKNELVRSRVCGHNTHLHIEYDHIITWSNHINTEHRGHCIWGDQWIRAGGLVCFIIKDERWEVSTVWLNILQPAAEIWASVSAQSERGRLWKQQQIRRVKLLSLSAEHQPAAFLCRNEASSDTFEAQESNLCRGKRCPPGELLLQDGEMFLMASWTLLCLMLNKYVTLSHDIWLLCKLCTQSNLQATRQK